MRIGSQVDSALTRVLRDVGVADADMHKYSFHSFRSFACCALLAADVPRWLIKKLLRWRGDQGSVSNVRTPIRL